MVTPGAFPLTSSFSRRQALAATATALALSTGAGPRRDTAARGSETRFPDPVRAIYLNPRVTTTWDGFLRLVDLIDRTELNGMVIDIKEDEVLYATEVPLFGRSGSVAPVYDPAAMVETLREHGIASIARLVVFKDPIVAAANPGLAVRDSVTGGLWYDMNGYAWVNPFDESLWDANAALAVEAAALGFDEIQLDYVRFPTDGDLTRMDFGRPITETARTETITDFSALCSERLLDAGLSTRMAADIFGYTLFVPGDLGIGQNADSLAPHFDVLCPMVYPSHFPEGSIDVPGHPNDSPYETIEISMAVGADRFGVATGLRPWLQAFSLPGMTPYGTDHVRAQIDAADAAGTGGWMLWDPDNAYDEAALRPSR
ncbi:MAG: GTP-binding protein [Chloroflexia bacterium]|nr:GTP-binding protein [Chloroflexia bacterium]